MNTMQIYCKLKSLRLQRVYIDVLSIDQLCKYDIKPPFALVVNTEKSTVRRAGHLVAIYQKSKQDSVKFFDSYGFPFDYFSPAFSQFVYSNSKDVVSNDRQIQCFNSSTCGEHCIYFLYQCYLQIPFTDIIRSYSEECNENDSAVVSFCQNIPNKFTSNIRNICLQECVSYNKMRDMK